MTHPQDFAAKIAAHMRAEPRARHLVADAANMMNMTYTVAESPTSLSYSASDLGR